MRRRRLASGGLLLALLAAACGGRDHPPPPAPATASPEPAPAPTPLQPAAAAPAADPLCAALGRIVDSEPEGFLTLRASPADAQQWNGALIPAGFDDCWIEDGATAGARYACSSGGGGVAQDSPDPLVPVYLDLLVKIDACLVQLTWYPLSWQRAPDRLAAEGGQDAVWRAAGSGPAPAVTLSLVQHPERSLWFVRLGVGPPGGR